MNRTETRVLAAAIAFMEAEMEMRRAKRELSEAVSAARILGLHLDPRIMEVCGDVPDISQ